MVTAVGHAAGRTHTRARRRVCRWHLPPGRALVCRQPVQLLRGGPPLSPALKGYSSVPSRAMHRHTRTHTHTLNGQQVLTYPGTVQLPFLCVAHLSVSTPEYRPPIPSGQRPFLTPHASRFHWQSLFTLGSFFAALGLSRKAVHDSDPCLYLRRLFPSLVANKSSRIQGPCSFLSYAPKK